MRVFSANVLVLVLVLVLVPDHCVTFETHCEALAVCPCISHCVGSFCPSSPFAHSLNNQQSPPSSSGSIRVNAFPTIDVVLLLGGKAIYFVTRWVVPLFFMDFYQMVRVLFALFGA